MQILDNSTRDNIEQSLADIDWAAYQQRTFTASQAAWEDQVFYFLMFDRFSDVNEKGYVDNTAPPSVSAETTPPTQFDTDAYIADHQQWANQNNRWLGGSLILKIKKRHLALHRGRWYLREMSANNDFGSFGYQRMIGGRILVSRSLFPHLFNRLRPDRFGN